jgi:predicted permease
LGFRSLRRHSGFATAAVLTLGIGMGAVGSIYTLLQRVVLDPLPYPEPGRLVRIKNPVPGVEKGDEWNLSPAQYFHYLKNVPELSRIGMYRVDGGNFAPGGEPRRVRIASVTASMVPLLGARVVRGRQLSEADDRRGAPAVTVISYGLWQTRFGGHDSIVGKSIRLNDEPVTVIGVMARGVEIPRDRGEALAPQVDLWMTLQLNPAGPFYNNHTWPTIAQLKPGASPADVIRRFALLQPQLITEFPQAYSQGFFDRYGFHTIAVRLKSYVLGDMARNLWILFVAVGLVLLIACANVANLLLVRLETRRRELAIRAAIGARRSDVAREALIESVALAASGLALALVLVFASTRWLVSLAPPGIPRLEEVTVNGTVVRFLVLLAGIVATLLALGPALRMRRVSGAGLSVLVDGGRTTTGPVRQRVRNALVTAQVALALVLVVSAVLLLRGFSRLRSNEAGVDPRGVLTFEWFLPYQRYDSLTKVYRFHSEVLGRIRALPGVTAAGASEDLPFLGEFGCTVQGFEEPVVYDRIKAAGLTTCAGQAPTMPGYFEALRIPLVMGRYLTDDDNLAPERGAVVVTKSFADRFWPGENPIGKGVNPNGRSKPPFYHVVGVVGDVRNGGLDEPPAIGIFYPIVAMPGGGRWYPGGMHVVVRTDRDDPLALLPMMRHAINEVDPSIPLANAEPLTRLVSRSMGRTTFMMLLLAIAGGVALGLAAIGLYGLIAHLVARRASEIGVRIALGAEPRQVERMVVRGALRLAAVGAVVGGLGALAATRVLGSLLHGLPSWDPPAYGGALAVLAVVAGIAAWIPARRAARVDPVSVLREE